MTARRRRRAARLRISRDTVLFAVGLLGIGYETLLAGGDRPTLLVLFGAMVGLPAFLRTDEKEPATAPAAAPDEEEERP